MASLTQAASGVTNFFNQFTKAGESAGASMTAPITGAATEVFQILPAAGEATKQTAIKLGEGVGQSIETSLYGAAKGISSIGTIGLAGLGEGAGSGIASFGKGAGTALENLGTGAGKGTQNFAVGAIPAALIAVGIILVLGLSKSVARG